MIKIIGLLIVAGIFCIWRIVKEFKKNIALDLTLENYEEDY